MKTQHPLIKTTASRNSLLHSTVLAHSIASCLAIAWLALPSTARAECLQGCTSLSSTFFGDDALLKQQGSYTTAVGSHALRSNNTDGGANTAVGATALTQNTSGSQNTAVGEQALYDNTTGHGNTAIGQAALTFSTISDYNTAAGYHALYSNTNGTQNTASGAFALYANTEGGQNTATGFDALSSTTTGGSNSAYGSYALYFNSTGSSNTALGRGALFRSTTSNNNAAVGYQALRNNTTGANSTACGTQALFNCTTGNNNIGLGNSAGTNLTGGSNNIDIGNAGVAGESNTIRIGESTLQTNTYIAGIYGAALASGSSVRIDSSGHLGTTTSSARFKKEIKPMEKASETILALQPVTFRYKEKIDAKGIPQFGLVAEEVEKVDPALVERDQEGKPYTVRYEAVNAMLLNEFLKEHRELQELKKQVEALSAGLAKVSAQVELSRSSPQTVLNGQ